MDTDGHGFFNHERHETHERRKWVQSGEGCPAEDGEAPDSGRPGGPSSTIRGWALEHFHKSCSAAESDLKAAVFLVLGFVSAQFVSPSPAIQMPAYSLCACAQGSQGFQTCAFAKASPIPKILAPPRDIISVKALKVAGRDFFKPPG